MDGVCPATWKTLGFFCFLLPGTEVGLPQLSHTMVHLRGSEPSLGHNSIVHQELPSDQVMDQPSTCMTGASKAVCLVHVASLLHLSVILAFCGAVFLGIPGT